MKEIKDKLKSLTNMDWKIISVNMNGVEETYYSAPDGQRIDAKLIDKYIEVTEKCNCGIIDREKKINQAADSIKGSSKNNDNGWTI